MTIAIAMLVHDSFASPGIDGRRGYAKLLSELIGAEHAARAQPFKTILQMIRRADHDDLLVSEGLTFPVRVTQFVKPLCDLSIGAGLEQFVDLVDHFRKRLAD